MNKAILVLIVSSICGCTYITAPFRNHHAEMEQYDSSIQKYDAKVPIERRVKKYESDVRKHKTYVILGLMPKEINHPICVAAAHKDLPAVKKLYNKDINKEAILHSMGMSLNWPYDTDELFLFLLNKYSDQVPTDLLSRACNQLNVKLVKALLSKEIDVNNVTVGTCPPLIEAQMAGLTSDEFDKSAKISELLIAHGADVNINLESPEIYSRNDIIGPLYKTPLYYAVMRKNVKCIQLLLKHGAEVHNETLNYSRHNKKIHSLLLDFYKKEPNK